MSGERTVTDLGLAAVGGRVRILDLRDLEGVPGDVDRRVQLPGEAGERLGGDHRFPERLELLEGLVRALGAFLRAALDVVAEHRAGPQERRQRRQVLGHLAAEVLGQGSRHLAKCEQSLNLVAHDMREVGSA